MFAFSLWQLERQSFCGTSDFSWSLHLPKQGPKTGFSAMACLDGYCSPYHHLLLRWIPDSRMFHKQEGGRPFPPHVPSDAPDKALCRLRSLHDGNAIWDESNTLLQRMGLIQDEILPKKRTEKMKSATPKTRLPHSQHGCEFTVWYYG